MFYSCSKYLLLQRYDYISNSLFAPLLIKRKLLLNFVEMFGEYTVRSNALILQKLKEYIENIKRKSESIYLENISYGCIY